jgi:hypothetical protein
MKDEERERETVDCMEGKQQMMNIFRTNENSGNRIR